MDRIINGTNAPNTCHGCHGPVGAGAHIGSAIGKARCSLPHNILCRGNIVEDGSWRACPPNFVFDPNLVVSNTGFESTLNPSAFNPELEQGSTPNISSPANSPVNSVAASGQGATGGLDNPVGQGVTSDQSGIGEHGVITEQRLNEGRGVSGVKRVNWQEPNEVNHQQSNIGFSDLPLDLQTQIENFRAQNQKNKDDGRQDKAENLNIKDLRSDQNLCQYVELVLSSLRDNIPSLAPAPTVESFQSRGTSVTHSQAVQNNTRSVPAGCEWLTDSHGNRHLVNIDKQGSSQIQQFPNMNQAQQIHPNSQPQTPLAAGINSQAFRIEYRCSPTTGEVWQEKIPVYDRSPKEPEYRTEFRCSPTTGRVWQVRIPVSDVNVSPQPKYKWEWRIDANTGEKYQVQVPSVSWANKLEETHESRIGQPPFIDQSQGDVSRSSQQQLQQQAEAKYNYRVGDSEIAGISKLDKSGARKSSRVVELAKQCPVKWAKTTTVANINLPLYTWASILELEAALSGRSSTMSNTEVVGKLRHIKCILEVCCLNSASTDFNTYGWNIAKDYASKVEDEVSQGLTSWQHITPGVRTGALVSAQMDCQRQTLTKANKKDGDNIKICTTYNRCETKGKCEYELNNPDKKCQRKHECSWCRSNLSQGNRHQAWECKKREA